MTEQEKLAREWADYAKNVAVSSPEQQAAADFILAHTAPPTMADVQWDAREHLGTIGVGEDGVEWVMLGRRPDGRIVGITADFQKLRDLRPKWLTPNGKRYELREVAVSSNENVGADQPEHPKALRTVEDYEDAPNSTIVAIQGFHTVWVKDKGTWSDGEDCTETSDYMAGEPREVLRWGRGE